MRSGCHYPDGDHQHSTEQSRGRTIQWQNFELSTADENVSDPEDDGCYELLLPVIHSACITDWVSGFNEHNFFAKLSRNA